MLLPLHPHHTTPPLLAPGKEYAVKSIPKVLRDPHASERKKASQIPYLKQEVEVLLAMRGTLNVANLEVRRWGQMGAPLGLSWRVGGQAGVWYEGVQPQTKCHWG